MSFSLLASNLYNMTECNNVAKFLHTSHFIYARNWKRTFVTEVCHNCTQTRPVLDYKKQYIVQSNLVSMFLVLVCVSLNLVFDLIPQCFLCHHNQNSPLYRYSSSHISLQYRLYWNWVLLTRLPEMTLTIMCNCCIVHYLSVFYTL